LLAKKHILSAPIVSGSNSDDDDDDVVGIVDMQDVVAFMLETVRIPSENDNVDATQKEEILKSRW
jgi:hypothetical protein